MRILQVVQRMGCGGIETWLMHVLRNIDREKYQMDFMVSTYGKQIYDDEIKSLGSDIIPCSLPAHPIEYIRNFRRLLRERGPYDVVHCHGGYSMGLTLKLAAQAGVPCRIIHRHSTSVEKGRLRSRLYRPIVRYWMFKYMTDGLGCSADACRNLFGQDWQKDARIKVLLYGFDFSKFLNLQENRFTVRRQFNIPLDALVIGHVGRFFQVKNHSFLVEICNEIARRRKDAFFLFVGEGPLKKQIESQVSLLECRNRFIFAGVTTEVHSMMAAMDVLVLPSLYEGLGIVVVEAQAAGLNCVISDVVPQEVDVIPSQVSRLSLSQGASLWADTVLKMASSGRPDQQKSAQIIANSRFGIDRCITELTQIYNKALVKNISETS